MKPVDKAVNITLALSLFFTIGFVLGIPSIIFGAIYHIWVVMGIGIAFCVAGFYGMPLTWVAYGNRRSLRRVVCAIVDECIYTVPELAEHLSLTEREVEEHLTTCFRKQYLSGYRRNGDRIVLNEGIPLGKKEYAVQCPSCGAKFLYSKDNPYCPYCTAPYNPQE